MEEMINASYILKAGKAPGIDNINNEMISTGLTYYPEIFLYIFNTILENGGGIPSWSISLIVPIHKKGPEDDPENYRGIALISCLAKFFYSILNNRLLQYCIKHEVFSPTQLGFLPGNRTSDAHIILHNLIRKYCHKNKSKLYGCFIDFSKAFDNLPRNLLFEKLVNYGITGKFYEILKNMYQEDKVGIKINESISPLIETMNGVRQGCVLSPTLFNIFMSDLPNKLCKDDNVKLDDNTNINCLLWADDIVLLSESEDGINRLLQDLHRYTEINQLKVNTEKTKCMIFNKTGRLLHKTFYLGNYKLETVRSYKYLGLVFTPSGEIKSALDDLRSRALKAYMALKSKLGSFFSEYVIDSITLFDTLIKPILLYGSDFWGCLKLPTNNPIENLHMQFCKQLLGVQKNTTNIGVLLELGRTPLALDAQKAAIKNWERIRNLKANQVIISSYKNAHLESLYWINSIKNLLGQNGMQNLFNESVPPYTQDANGKLYNRVKDIFHQQSFTSIEDMSSKLRTYGLIKTRIGLEDYLITIRNYKLRSCLSRLRLSNHKLMIEVGRHQKLQRHERICQVCKRYVEDEVHFLINCELYDKIRKPLFEFCIEQKTNFMYYTDKEKFIFMMTSSDLTYELAKFLHKAFNIRDEHLKANNPEDNDERFITCSERLDSVPVGTHGV